MNVDPSKGIGRALLTALRQLAQSSGHGELGSAKIIILGFSGTGSLVGRLAEFAPDRVLAVIPTAPGHFDPLGVDTINLSIKTLAIPQLILVGSSISFPARSDPTLTLGGTSTRAHPGRSLSKTRRHIVAS